MTFDKNDLVERLRHAGKYEAADRIEELEAQIKKDALQYLSDTGQMGDAVDDLTRRHQHALHKIDVLEVEPQEVKADLTEAVVCIYELENKLSKAMQVIEAFCEDEGYVPKRVADILQELNPTGVYHT